ncbi:putative chromosome segregation protein BIR1 [Aspergillus bombycis]|uniref:Putative chromosome segregation protein BIR1 n=1 Tax=Aspergillus bombycis TaxID=109264 RepID=A0A1F8A9Y6_9EURO|nr:putative chromosome segregation protein BIR1 [Aspergillus bombycis]OGM48481.1 putative chromosome segregation protein BIR1 [Aspergillus bombycis]
MADEMETFAARLASFDLVLHPEKRRTSSAKAVKSIAWPHRRPSPAELAHAGFYYNPYETNPDNTTCFLCHRALDGWEEEDNPITEHLKHANDCGWAVMMDIQQHSSNPAEIEDPTCDKIREARLATFGTSWPHDGKRGWVCQSEKMVDGGWYFCPTEESNDLASCAYCKLSLDGWEPKDDPFDEHYRRSADCSFFVFAQPPGVSSFNPINCVGSYLGNRRPMDQSTISQPATKTKATKKSSKSKSKNVKSKKEEAAETDSQMDIDTADYSQPEPPKTKRTTRGKKRTSDQVEREQVNVADSENFEDAEPPTKKRATKSRNSIQHDANQNDEVTVDIQPEESIPEDEPKNGRGTTKKKAPSKSRKASSGSSTSKTASKSRVPNDDELDAALVADLEQPETEEQSLQVVQKPSKKSKSKKKQKTTPEPQDVVDHVDEEETRPGKELPEEPEEPEESGSRPAAQEDKPGHVKSTRNSRGSNIPEPQPDLDTEKAPKTRKRSGAAETSKDDMNPRVHESFVSVEIPARVPTPVKQPKDEPNDKDLKKKTKQISSTEKAKKSKKTSKAEAPEREETPAQQEMDPKHSPGVSSAGHDLPEQQKPHEPQAQEVEQPSTRRRSSRVPPKTAERYSDIPEEKQFARTLAGSRGSDSHRMSGSADQGNMSPIPTSKSTPSLSPQSSDAENQPPSLKPSATRTLVVSPSKQQAVRIPLAPNTPSPSKRNANAGGLRTTHPWNPIDIDEILLAGSSDKENVDLSSALNDVKGDLTSPEKKMSVEEWIKWQAKNGEEKLRQECERLVGQFEREGARAMRVLEGIECID